MAQPPIPTRPTDELRTTHRHAVSNGHVKKTGAGHCGAKQSSHSNSDEKHQQDQQHRQTAVMWGCLSPCLLHQASAEAAISPGYRLIVRPHDVVVLKTLFPPSVCMVDEAVKRNTTSLDCVRDVHVVANPIAAGSILKRVLIQQKGCVACSFQGC